MHLAMVRAILSTDIHLIMDSELTKARNIYDDIAKIIKHWVVYISILIQGNT